MKDEFLNNYTIGKHSGEGFAMGQTVPIENRFVDVYISKKI